MPEPGSRDQNSSPTFHLQVFAIPPSPWYQNTVVRTLLFICVLTFGATNSARAEWVRNSELTFRTANTLPPGSLEVGIAGPLQYGISERVQLGIHPILLVVGAVNLNLRWRFATLGKVTLAADIDTSLSLLQREDLQGNEVTSDCTYLDATAAGGTSSGAATCGFPSRIRTLFTASVELGKHVLLSFGGGPTVDLAGLNFARLMLELHGSLIWRITSEQLFMIHGSGYVQVLAEGEAPTPMIQLMYARACGDVNIGLGVAFGDFPIFRSVNHKNQWLVYPVMDLWWRF